jgi:hypothetical protein
MQDILELVPVVTGCNLAYPVQQHITVVEVEVDYILQERLAPVD